MKKKIKDLTLEEMFKICKSHNLCVDCNLQSIKTGCRCYKEIMSEVLVNFDLEREVEVDE